MNRRAFLGSVASLSVGPLSAGCLRSKNENEIKINEILIANLNYDSIKRLHLELSYDGSTIHDKIHEIPKRDGRVAGTVTIDDFPDQPGEYVIETSLESSSKVKTVNAKSAAHSSADSMDMCAIFDIQIVDSERIGITARQCESTS